MFAFIANVNVKWFNNKLNKLKAFFTKFYFNCFLALLNIRYNKSISNFH